MIQIKELLDYIQENLNNRRLTPESKYVFEIIGAMIILSIVCETKIMS